MHRFKQQFLSWHGLLVFMLASLAKRLSVTCVKTGGGGGLTINHPTLSVQRAASPNPCMKASNLMSFIRNSGGVSIWARLPRILGRWITEEAA